MANRIRHEGVVEAVENGTVAVRILQSSGCASCKVAGHCNAYDSKVKTVYVHPEAGTAHWHVGDAVTVSASTSVAYRALLLSFGVPFVVMVVVLVAVVMSTSDEIIGGVAAVVSLLPYYVALYLMRSRIGRGMAFSIDG